jgi:transglutaminase-like putative cysteine protease
MKILTVHHATTYRYSQPVSFGIHRLMLRPRDSHDLRLVGAEITLSPPGEMRWMHDVFGNSVTIVDFGPPASELSIVSTLHLQRYALSQPVFPIAPEAQIYPFVYSTNDRADLARLLERQHPDPRGVVDAWAKQFAGRFVSTYNLLSNMNFSIKSNFKYIARDDEGTQSPVETLEKKSGTCRDFALLFIEAVRSLGFGARFVSGYLYDPALDGGTGSVQGAGATHAWADVYLPGAGWVEYDPTNGTIAAENLFRGHASDFLGMSIDVTVTQE